MRFRVNVFNSSEINLAFHLIVGEGNGSSTEMTLWSDKPISSTIKLLTRPEWLITRSSVYVPCGVLGHEHAE